MLIFNAADVLFVYEQVCADAFSGNSVMSYSEMYYLLKPELDDANFKYRKQTSRGVCCLKKISGVLSWHYLQGFSNCLCIFLFN